MIDLNAKEEILYEDSYVAFLDILGFRNLVMSGKKEDLEKISQYLGIVDSVINYLKKIPSKSKIRTIVVSDSVILSVTKEDSTERNIFLFRNLCIAVGLIQQNLAMKNLWLRGGISTGKAYFNDRKKQIVGPAYVNAFEIEERFAEFPRVIIDSKIIPEFECQTAGQLINVINQKENGGNQFPNWSSDILFYWNQELYDSGNYIFQDVALFIDYLSPNVKMTNDELKLIVNNLQVSIYNNVAFYDKYRWVADYLKSIYRYRVDLDKEIEKILIDL